MDKLGLKAKDKVVFELEGETARLRLVPRTAIRKGFGAVSPLQTPENFSAIREQMEMEIARDAD